MRSEIQAQLPSVELDTRSEAEQAAHNWLKLMGVEIGDTIGLLPLGGTPGEWFRGELVNITFGPLGPLMICWRPTTNGVAGEVVSMPWVSVSMLSKVVQVVNDGPTMEEIEKFMIEQGKDIPAEVQVYLDEHREG